MKIIKDNFNKKIKCEYCNSVFTYNEKELIKITLSSEIKDKITKFQSERMNIAEPISSIGEGIICPLCKNVIVTKRPSFFFKQLSKKESEKDLYWGSLSW